MMPEMQHKQEPLECRIGCFRVDGKMMFRVVVQSPMIKMAQNLYSVLQVADYVSRQARAMGIGEIEIKAMEDLSVFPHITPITDEEIEQIGELYHSGQGNVFK